VVSIEIKSTFGRACAAFDLLDAGPYLQTLKASTVTATSRAAA
jgi:hypothetical protein